MNVILNPGRTLETVVSVNEATARSPECPVNILLDDVFIENAPPIPEGMHTPLLNADWKALLSADPAAQVWEETNQLAHDADLTAKNILAIKAKAGQIIYARYSVEKQNNMQTRYKVLESIIIGTYPNDDGTFGPARELTTDEKAEMLTLRKAWDWTVSVRNTSNLAEIAGTPVDEVVWPA